MLKEVPASRAMTVLPASTLPMASGTGTLLLVVLLLPSWPLLLEPQPIPRMSAHSKTKSLPVPPK